MRACLTWKFIKDPQPPGWRPCAKPILLSGVVALVGLRYRQGLKVCLRRTGQVSSGRLCS